MVLTKYNSELMNAIDKISSIRGLKYDSINVYGSSVNEEMFTENVSDIDVIIMCKDFEHLDKQSIMDQLCRLNIDFKEKRPIVIKDSLCERIEFYVGYDRINIDVTICSGLVPTRASLETDAWYDGFEALMGGVYLTSKGIYGTIPDYDVFKESYYPFYDDDLRRKRLDVLANRLITYSNRIKGFLDSNSPEAGDHIFKIKKYFLKFLYIYNRTYFWTPEKHTHYQLTRFLEMPEEEKRLICFMDGNFHDAARGFITYADSKIDEYVKAKR